MNITDLITKETVLLDIEAKDKHDVIYKVASALHTKGVIENVDTYVDDVLAREAQGSTGIGYGIAIPHAKSDAVNTPALAFARIKGGVDYEALDGENSDLLFMIAVPSGGENLHLKILQRLSRKLMHDDFRDALRDATDEENILTILNEMDKEE